MKEIEKWSKVHENVVEIEEFLVWLGEKGIVLCESQEDWYPRYFIARKTFRELLEEFYEIDAVKLDKERRELLLKARKSRGDQEMNYPRFRIPETNRERLRRFLYPFRMWRKRRKLYREKVKK